MRVYKQSDDEEEVKAIQDLLNSTNSSVMQTYDSLLEDYKSNNSDSSNPVMTIISNMWKIVSNAGKLKSEVSNTYENLEITFTTPNETADSHFVFTDLNVQFSDYGKYQFLFIVDGIESTISDVVEITQIQSKVQQENVIFSKKNY